MTWGMVVSTLRECELADWQIARAVAVIRAGGSVRDAEAALYDRVPAGAAHFDAELPVEGLHWPAVDQAVARLERELGARVSADEAGARLHHLGLIEGRGRHDETTRCRYCPIDGSEALRRLRRREGPPDEQARSPRLADNSSGGPSARATDPQTSHAAAKSISPTALRDSQEAILRLFRELGPMTDDLLVDRYAEATLDGLKPLQSPSGIRTRRAELVDASVLRDSGRKVRLASGRHAIVWEIANLVPIAGGRTCVRPEVCEDPEPDL